jgi:hypothetical protein
VNTVDETGDGATINKKQASVCRVIVGLQDEDEVRRMARDCKPLGSHQGPLAFKRIVIQLPALQNLNLLRSAVNSDLPTWGHEMVTVMTK